MQMPAPQLPSTSSMAPSWQTCWLRCRRLCRRAGGRAGGCGCGCLHGASFLIGAAHVLCIMHAYMCVSDNAHLAYLRCPLQFVTWMTGDGAKALNIILTLRLLRLYRVVRLLRSLAPGAGDGPLQVRCSGRAGRRQLAGAGLLLGTWACRSPHIPAPSPPSKPPVPALFIAAHDRAAAVHQLAAAHASPVQPVCAGQPPGLHLVSGWPRASPGGSQLGCGGEWQQCRVAPVHAFRLAGRSSGACHAAAARRRLQKLAGGVPPPSAWPPLHCEAPGCPCAPSKRLLGTSTRPPSPLRATTRWWNTAPPARRGTCSFLNLSCPSLFHCVAGGTRQ